MSTITPYILINDTGKNAIKNMLHSVCGQWHEHWLDAQSSSITLNISVNQELENYLGGNINNGWRAVRCHDVTEPVLYYITTENDLLMLSKLMENSMGHENSDEESLSPMLRKVCEEVFINLADNIAREYTASTNVEMEHIFKGEENLATELWKRGSGSILAEINIMGFSCSFLLVTNKLNNAQPKQDGNRHSRLTTMQEAIQKEDIQITAWAGRAEISIGELSRLSIGDTIVLEKKLSEPMDITVMDHGESFHGFLGKKDKKRSLQLSH